MMHLGNSLNRFRSFHLEQMYSLAFRAKSTHDRVVLNWKRSSLGELIALHLFNSATTRRMRDVRLSFGICKVNLFGHYYY